MIEWRDEGVILAARRHGEADAIVDAFTALHGRCAAMVKGGAGRRLAPILQPGEQVALDMRARLESHLGTARVEPVRARAGAIMADRRALAALASAAALLCAFLPEAEPHPALYASSLALFDALALAAETSADWPALYARWELSLLDEIGFGLDLSACAATGARADLVWVSPRSGQAVSRSAGAPYAARLLPLPAFLRDPATAPEAGAVADALRLTGWFLEHRAAPAFGRDALPKARARLADAFAG